MNKVTRKNIIRELAINIWVELDIILVDHRFYNKSQKERKKIYKLISKELIEEQRKVFKNHLKKL
jgi:hypothetical protein